MAMSACVPIPIFAIISNAAEACNSKHERSFLNELHWVALHVILLLNQCTIEKGILPSFASEDERNRKVKGTNEC